jgi:hypothetical protein
VASPTSSIYGHSAHSLLNKRWQTLQKAIMFATKRSWAHPTNSHPTTAMSNSDSGSVMKASDKQQPACEGM